MVLEHKYNNDRIAETNFINISDKENADNNSGWCGTENPAEELSENQMYKVKSALKVKGEVVLRGKKTSKIIIIPEDRYEYTATCKGLNINEDPIEFCGSSSSAEISTTIKSLFGDIIRSVIGHSVPHMKVVDKKAGDLELLTDDDATIQDSAVIGMNGSTQDTIHNLKAKSSSGDRFMDSISKFKLCFGKSKQKYQSHMVTEVKCKQKVVPQETCRQQQVIAESEITVITGVDGDIDIIDEEFLELEFVPISTIMKATVNYEDVLENEGCIKFNNIKELCQKPEANNLDPTINTKVKNTDSSDTILMSSRPSTNMSTKSGQKTKKVNSKMNVRMGFKKIKPKINILKATSAYDTDGFITPVSDDLKSGFKFEEIRIERQSPINNIENNLTIPDDNSSRLVSNVLKKQNKFLRNSIVQPQTTYFLPDTQSMSFQESIKKLYKKMSTDSQSKASYKKLKTTINERSDDVNASVASLNFATNNCHNFINPHLYSFINTDIPSCQSHYCFQSNICNFSKLATRQRCYKTCNPIFILPCYSYNYIFHQKPRERITTPMDFTNHRCVNKRTHISPKKSSSNEKSSVTNLIFESELKINPEKADRTPSVNVPSATKSSVTQRLNKGPTTSVVPYNVNESEKASLTLKKVNTKGSFLSKQDVSCQTTEYITARSDFNSSENDINSLDTRYGRNSDGTTKNLNTSRDIINGNIKMENKTFKLESKLNESLLYGDPKRSTKYYSVYQEIDDNDADKINSPSTHHGEENESDDFRRSTKYYSVYKQKNSKDSYSDQYMIDSKPVEKFDKSDMNDDTRRSTKFYSAYQENENQDLHDKEDVDDKNENKSQIIGKAHVIETDVHNDNRRSTKFYSVYQENENQDLHDNEDVDDKNENKSPISGKTQKIETGIHDDHRRSTKFYSVYRQEENEDSQSVQNVKDRNNIDETKSLLNNKASDDTDIQEDLNKVTFDVPILKINSKLSDDQRQSKTRFYSIRQDLNDEMDNMSLENKESLGNQHYESIGKNKIDNKLSDLEIYNEERPSKTKFYSILKHPSWVPDILGHEDVDNDKNDDVKIIKESGMNLSSANLNEQISDSDKNPGVHISMVKVFSFENDLDYKPDQLKIHASDSRLSDTEVLLNTFPSHPSVENHLLADRNILHSDNDSKIHSNKVVIKTDINTFINENVVDTDEIEYLVDESEYDDLLEYGQEKLEDANIGKYEEDNVTDS